MSRLTLADLVVTLHKNYSLQIIKMDKKGSDVHVIEDPAIKEVQAILFDDMFLFMVTPKRILVAKNFTEIFDVSIGNHSATCDSWKSQGNFTGRSNKNTHWFGARKLLFVA